MTLAMPHHANSAAECEPMQYSIHIVEEGRDEEPHTSLDDIKDPLFKQYVEAVSQHVLAKIPEASGGQAAADENASVELFFVRRPMLGPAATSAALPEDEPAREGARHLDSPWVELTISPPPDCTVRGVFHWSERQFLLDQAVMDGADVSPGQPLPVIDTTEFQQWASEYADAVVNEPSPEVRASAIARLSQHIPPDVLWLFRHAWQSTLAPFYVGAERDLHATIERVAEAYTELTIGIVDRFIESENVEERHDNIRSLQGLVPHEAYSIEQLH